MESGRSRFLVLGAAAVAGAVGVALGAGLLGGGATQDGARETPETVTLRERVDTLERQLAASQARVAELEREEEPAALAGTAPAPGAEPASEPAAARSPSPSGDADGPGDALPKGKNPAPAKGKKASGPFGLPEGMTLAEQTARVRAVVEAHDWNATVGALRAGVRNRSGAGAGMTLAQRDALKGFFGMLGELQEVGVGFYDARVARVFVPSWTRALGADLDARQADALGAYVEEASRQREATQGPAPEVPPRYAHEKAEELRRTIAIEEELRSLLRPDQLAGYLAEVGDDPFDSALGLKTNRMPCEGRTVAALAEEVTRIWLSQYALDEALRRPQVEAAARRFAADALAVPPVPDGLDAFSRRRAVLDRAVTLLTLQGDAEQAMLAELALPEDVRDGILSRRCPALVIAGP